MNTDPGNFLSCFRKDQALAKRWSLCAMVRL